MIVEKMECKHSTPSVIARLMGLEELPPRQSVQKQQTVLSENYLRRVASVGVRGKRASHERRSFRMGIEDHLEMKDKANLSSTEMDAFTRQKLDVRYRKHQPLKEFHDCLEIVDSHNWLLKYLEESDSLYAKLLNDLQGVPLHLHYGNTTVLNSSRAYEHKNIDRCRKLGSNTKPLQKLEDSLVSNSYRELGVDNLHKFSSSTLDLNESPSRVVVLKPNFRKTENASRYISSPVSYEGMHSGEKREECLSFGNGNCCVEVKEKKNVAKKPEPIRQSVKISRDTAKETFRKNTQDISIDFTELPRSKFKGGGDHSVEDSVLLMHSSPNFSLLKKQSQSLISNLDGKFTVKEAKKRISERWKTTQKFQELGLGERGFTLAEMLAMPNHEICPRNSNSKLGKHGLSNSGSLVADVVTNSNTEVKRKELHDELPACILLVKEADSFSRISDSSFQQDISMGVPEEGISSCCSGMGLKSFVSLKENHKPCPDSVLEPPFKDGISSTSESSESFDADLHFKSSESSSEGPGMIVSSDEDTGEESMCQAGQYFMKMFRVEESRDFSYLIDILTEADVRGKTLDTGFDTLNTPQSPISHLVFETLEKKYSEQISWKRSERRLLFDRINSGLTGILQLCTGVSSWAKPGTIRFNLRQSWVVTEKELWTLLVRQEKEEANKDSLDKVMGGGITWLELGEDIEEICKDIERLLIDGLIVEIASSERF